ncbi:hypothetical protein EB796_001031 [Bugula neritina]|uniref:Uncharacterized protein n=1 Tax=Bugula neritina TaxID=10212 RepID=A0A7J7KR50_BUGNE|nr:hypothetical protein EB796_001031 [Bugula neritina]
MVMQCSWLVVIVALFIGCVAANDEIQPRHNVLPDVCPHKNITALLALNQSTVSVYLGEGQTESFPEGIHIKTVPFNSRSCTYYVIVERARVKRRLSFKSEFDVRCELIDYDNDSRRSLRTSIIRRKDQLQSICEEVLCLRRHQCII